jgi:hypothetical protein
VGAKPKGAERYREPGLVPSAPLIAKSRLILMEEFTLFFMVLDYVHLNQVKDEIRRRWTASGKFSIASAYRCQFRGSIALFLAKALLVCKPMLSPSASSLPCYA